MKVPMKVQLGIMAMIDIATNSQGGRVAVLLDMGLDYSQVKSMLLEGKMVGAIRAVPA